MKSLTTGLVLFIGVLLIPLGAVRASGPALHIRDAKSAFEDLVELDPAWAALADVPLADLWLSYGAMAPDFHGGLDSIQFGHSKTLSYHLLDLTEEMGPEYRLFAFGHMTHQGSDGATEGLMVPAYFSSAPIGLYQVYGESPDGRADSEGIIEMLGDLIVGDMHGFVDAIYVFWMEDGTDHDKALEIFGWYCEVGAAYSGKVTDCEVALAELNAVFDQVKPLFGLMNLEQAHEMLDMLLDQPLSELIDLGVAGEFAALVVGDIQPTPEFEVEVARIKASVFADPEFWEFYEEIKDLGPTYALEQYEHRPPQGAWPYWDWAAVVCGNVQSIMNFRPEDFAVVPGLIVDDLEWYETESETKITNITPPRVGAPLYASIRFFSALPFAGTVTGVVRRDMPGFDQSGDAILGEASVTVDIDPLEYVTTPRSLLEIPFTADTDGALGVYVELRVDPEERPWFTTSWDRLWGAGDLYMARPLYWDNFSTYGHWPPSLPVLAPVLDEAGADLFVQARIAPTGPGIGGASVLLTDGSAVTAGAGGLAVFDWLPLGDVEIQVEAPGYLSATPAAATLEPGPEHWIIVPLHGIPEIAPPLYAASDVCIPLSWDPARFGGQAESFEVVPLDAVSLEPVGPPAVVPGGGTGEYCFDEAPDDGTVVLFHAVAIYADGAQGAEGDGPPGTLDGSPPTLALTVVGFDDDPCVESETTGISIQAEDPHAPLLALAWSVDDGDWMELPPKTDETGHVIDAHLQVVEHLGAQIRVRVTNAAGLETVSDAIEVPAAAAWCGVPEWGPEPTPEPSPESAADVITSGPDTEEEVVAEVMGDVVEGESQSSHGGGCDGSGSPANPSALVILLTLAYLGRRFADGSSIMKSLLACLVLFIGALLPHGVAQASGPGLHVRDAKTAFEGLSAQDPAWAALADIPLAEQWLAFGAIAPDLQVGLASIKFGHSKTLSYHVLDLAEELGPEYQLFAFGHLTHQGSDGATEGLVVPAYFSSAPIGLYSIYNEYEDGRADSEGLIEVVGDLIVGDMHGFVDAIYMLWMEEGVVHDKALEIFYWYCEVGAEFSGKVTDCEAALAELTEVFDKVEPLFGLMDLEQAHDMLDMLLDQPLSELIDLAVAGDFVALAGGDLEPSADFDVEVARIKESVFADPEFWSFYEEIKDLGPTYALEQYEHRPSQGAWPYYDKNAMICGNVQSIMNFLPEDYAVVPGLIVDDLTWYEVDTGKKVLYVSQAGVGSSLYASVRFFSALPFSGTVTGVVKKDMPGFDQTGDAILGEASVAVDIDPLDYVTTPRSVLEIPFTADTDGSLGVYVELRIDPEERPWFTTSWDRLWGAGDLYMARPLYWDNFGTYYHWPPSLPVLGPVLAEVGADLLVQARVAPAGPGIGGAKVLLTDGPATTTGAGGLAVFDWLPTGDVEILVKASGYLSATPVTATLVGPGPGHWVIVPLHGIPEIAPPLFAASDACIPLSWDPTRFGGQAESFEVVPLDAVELEPVGPPAAVPGGGVGEYCFDEAPDDGTVVLFRAVTIYVDGAQGAEGDGPPGTLDGSSPVLDLMAVGFDDDPCVELETTGISIQAEDPHAPLTALAWSVDDGDWMELPPKTDETGHVIDAHLQVVEHLGAEIRVRVTNAAGLETVSDPVEIPVAAAWCGVPEWGPEPTPEPSPEPTEDVFTPAPDTVEITTEEVVSYVEDEPPSSRNGCDGSGFPANPSALVFLLALAYLGRRYRGRPHHT